jgi:hypothetical protein
MTGPSQSPAEDFTFDIYPGLDTELEAALARNQANGIADPAHIATSGLATAVGTNLNQLPDPNVSNTPEEVRAWAEPQIDKLLASMVFSVGEPLHSFAELETKHKSLPETLSRLYEARERLMNSSEVTPEGTPIGETMRLTLVPWGAFRRNLAGIADMVKEMRDRQSLTTNDDYLNDELFRALTDWTKLYRSPLKSITSQQADSMVTAGEYLDERIAQDGDWGVILTQVSNDAGVESLRGKSPDELTSDGNGTLYVEGVEVDGMGIFEWLATTLNHDPTQLSSQDASWLLANRFNDAQGVAQVPFGYFYDGQVASSLDWAYRRDDYIRPRLAVI